MDLKSKIILISGPTASGKSNFAIKLAKKIKGEIINADSMQVYKELRILTARPIKKEHKKIKHHLYGFQSVKKKFSTGEWLKLVIKNISTIKKRKKIPIKFRIKIRNLQKKIGQKKFFDQLVKLDPLINEKIKPTDAQRSIRAYEVKSYTKKSLVDWFKSTKSKFVDEDFIKIYIDFPRQGLLDRISLRTDQMLDQGAIDEVKKYLRLKVAKDKTSNKVIGIKEIKDFLNKKSDLSEVKEKILVKTRQYAKRQSTWARGHMMNWQKINPNDLKKFLKKI